MVGREYSGSDRTPVHHSKESSFDSASLEEEVSLVGMANVFLRQRRVFFWVASAVTAIALLLALPRPTLFTSSASFLPENSEASGMGFQALAQQFGVSFPGSTGERTPEFYADLITSTEILRQTVVRRHPLGGMERDQEETNLFDYYEVDGDSEEESIERAIESLTEDISVSTDGPTGVVSFGVTSSDPVLSQSVAAHILELVNGFDLTTRQTQARAQRLFAGERLSELTNELRVAEDSLMSFLIENRLFSNSPVLQFEHDRLQWAISMRQELVTSLAQEHEGARIEEVRSTPVITIIEPPRVPAIRDPKRRILILILGILLGAVVGMFAAFLVDSVEEARRIGSSNLDELASLWTQTLKDLRRVGTSLFRRSAG